MNGRFRVFGSAALGSTLMAALNAAKLKQVTLSAWDQYVRSADAAMQDRLRPGNQFLWADEAPDRRRHLRAGEILVKEAGEHNPTKVPSGLIHHWVGAVFVPNATLSKAGSQKWYGITTAVRVQEVEDHSHPSAHTLPFGQGSGYVRRSHSITRYEEGDGGVYIEIEAMALSREIPGAIRWVVDPIVRRFSKESLVTSLRQAQDAVSSSSQIAREEITPKWLAIPELASGFTLRSSQH